MQLRYNFRLYPNGNARAALARAFGCARVVFNDAVKARERAYTEGKKIPTSATLQRDLITRAKKTPERAWLGEVSHTMLQQSIRDSELGRPKLTVQDFRIHENGRMHLSRIGEIAVRWSRQLPAKPTSVTVIHDSAGRYFASFVIDIETSPLPPSADEVGLDLGLTSYAVDSSGRVLSNPRFLRKHERRLRRLQKALSRKQIGSANRVKARRRVARQHAKIADIRRGWLHQQTTRLIRDNQAIYLENLAVANLAQSKLAKSVYDASWRRFRELLEYKAIRYGRYIGVIGRFEPTSQVCSACGANDGPKPLSVRNWTCGICGTAHDRDQNAAMNILALGRRERLNACGAQVSPREILAQRDEAGTHLSAMQVAR